MKRVSKPILRMSAIVAFSAFVASAYSQAVKQPETAPAEKTPKKIPTESTTPPPPPPSSNEATPAAGDDSPILLTPFEVTSTADSGYQATDTLGGTRIRTELKDVGSAISVYTKEFMKDIGATDNSTLLQYTTNAEVAGTRGTYAGLGNGTSLDETSNLRAPSGAQRVRGLASADVTRDFFVTDIPTDYYNVDRVDIMRGPNSFMFGLGSPAGIVNTSTRNAEFRNRGAYDVRVGSYGSVRQTLDLNQQIIPGVLAIRFDALMNNEKYKQKPAFQDDHRWYLTTRFDPAIFKEQGFRTTIKIKYEEGDVKANRPRITPPSDSINPWFRAVGDQGMGKVSVPNGYVIGANTLTFSPWLGGVGDQQQPIWFIDGGTDELIRIYGGYNNPGARNPDGTIRGAAQGLIGRNFSGTFYGLTSYAGYAVNAGLPLSQFGQYKSMSLTDSSIFDFYNKLIDGPTKSEFENWKVYNIDIIETAFDDRLGIQLSLDDQHYKRGGQSLLGWNPTITVDILRNFQDYYLTPGADGTTSITNPNYGRPFIVAGPGNGNSYESDRRNMRGSLFGELRSSDFFGDGFLSKLLGRHRFNGVYSKDEFRTENVGWQMYAHSQAWDAYWNGNDGSTNAFTNRPPLSVIYLGSSLANATSAAGANIQGITAPVTLKDGNVYVFDSNWQNFSVPFNGAWTIPSNLSGVFTGTLTQASNPANYVGWNSNFRDNLMRYDMGADPRLLTRAQKSLRETESVSGSWQGFLWNSAVVPTLGWRYDKVTTKGVNALQMPLNRSYLNLTEGGTNPYALPLGPDDKRNSTMGYTVFSEHSTMGGVVVHLNRLLPRDILPINVSLSYNKSNNFQVTDARKDIYGKTIGNPTGSTKDYGILLSTKDQKYSFRAVKYETLLKNGNTTLDSSGLGNVVQQGLRFRNVFLYKLSNYPWSSREQPQDRNNWQATTVDNTTGRPVATGSPNSHVQTQAEADAMRDASIRAWNDIQRKLQGFGYFGAWGYAPTTVGALTDRATYEAAKTSPTALDPAPQYAPDPATVFAYTYVTPQGFAVTADTESKGYELELVANPLPNWRLSFNASKTEAIRTNVGGETLDEFVNYMDAQMAGAAGDMRQFSGGYNPFNQVRQNWNNWRGNYTLMKLQQGAAAAELRKWRYNVVTNYSFRNGILKGTAVGTSYRWQDKVIIGYPVMPAGSQTSFDLSRPYYGPAEDALDAWVSYERRIAKKINWKIQLNVRNLFIGDSKIPITVQPDGQTWAAVRIKPTQEWFVTNTFSF